MLSRTADHLFWMSRYIERAESTARILDANYQTSLLPPSGAGADAQLGWEGLLAINEQAPLYQARYGAVTAQGVMDFMVQDASNPSSILSCLRSARENARAVRECLTTEVWETQNQTWLEVQRLLQSGSYASAPAQFFEWVKYRSHLARGVAVSTMLRDEAMQFLNLGTFLERADNTARLMDVKFNAIEGEFYGAASERDQEYDFYHWSAILRSVAAYEIYRKAYRDIVRPERVAELLILRADMPRSLRACMQVVVEQLQLLANSRSQTTERAAVQLLTELQYSSIEDILAIGLHTYLTRFMDRINDLGEGINRSFLAAPELLADETR